MAKELKKWNGRRQWKYQRRVYGRCMAPKTNTHFMKTAIILFLAFIIWFNYRLEKYAQRKHGNPYSSLNRKRKRK